MRVETALAGLCVGSHQTPKGGYVYDVLQNRKDGSAEITKIWFEKPDARFVAGKTVNVPVTLESDFVFPTKENGAPVAK